MELRQLRYFVRIVELGSFSQAAAALDVVPSALSQQISRLESELSTRLLQRSSAGVRPTEAGLAFLHQARLALRHVDAAASAARSARLSGQVSVGMSPTIAGVLGLPLLLAMRERHPSVRVHFVETLSGHLADMLTARTLDLAIVFRSDLARRFSIVPLLEERLFVIGRQSLPGMPSGRSVRLSALGSLPLVLPSAPHDLRSMLDQAFARARVAPNVVAEIDGLAILMDFVLGGIAASIQPGAAIARLGPGMLAAVPISDTPARRPVLLASLSDDELSPAGLATRVVTAEVARDLVRAQKWVGAALHES
ncbi:MAG TPA: LysR family transcriptional regulator [Zeimonas sp.]